MIAATPRAATSTIRIVVTGDSHLSPALPRLSPQRRAERRQRLRAGFEAAVDAAIQRHAHVFIQAGDLFDTPTPANQDRAAVASALVRLRSAGIVCIGIGGNHDTPRLTTEQGGEAPQRVYAALDSLQYFPRHDVLVPQLFDLGGIRLAIAGLSNHPVAAPGSDPLAGIAIEDADGVLERADVGLVVLHAGLEGLCRPGEGERVVMRSSIAALPALMRIIVSGHIHHFAHEQVGTRTLVVCGSTERMEFGAPDGSSGCAWLEIGRDGAVHVEHLRGPEQRRMDLRLTTAQLWAAGATHYANGAVAADAIEPPPHADVLTQAARPDTKGASGPVAVIQRAIAAACTPDAMVRMRLSGPLTLEQYYQLALREVLAYGAQQAFTFDLDTSGLLLADASTPRRTDDASQGGPNGASHGGPIAPIAEVERLLAERLADAPAAAADDATYIEDYRAAATLLVGMLREAAGRESGR